MISIIGLVLACLVILGAIGIMIYDERFLEDVCDECERTDYLIKCRLTVYKDTYGLHDFYGLRGTIHLLRYGWLDVYETLCPDHAAGSYCLHCGEFWAGAGDPSFDRTGICSNCYEPEEDDYYDEYGLFYEDW